MPLVPGLNDCLRVRAGGSGFFLLRDDEGLWLIDTGWIMGRSRLRKELTAAGWEKLPLRGILMTHGHIDHMLNTGRLARENGIPVYGHPKDAARFAGHPRVERGLGRPLAELERRALSWPWFEPFVPQHWLVEGEVLPIWGGLRVVELPGHTMGHTGFFSERHGLLFCGDLFASFGRFSHLPPAIFNEDGEAIPGSVALALSLPLSGVLPNHGDNAPPSEHWQRLKRLAIS